MIHSLNRWAKTRVRNAVARTVHSVLPQQSNELWGAAPWYQENYWEPPVQLALRDLCRPGATAFDVGANMGGLTMLMSRLVGPRGCVLGFEASPRIIPKTQHNVAFSGCGNVQLFHNAVYSRSHETMPIYLGSHLNDSIYAENGSSSEYRVTTLALDDLVDETGLVPDVVKMDIEGAEFDALLGFRRTIERARPHLILETQPNDSRCLDFLRSLGYRAIDLNCYREIRSPADYPPGTQIRNLVYVHDARLAETGYALPFESSPVAALSSGDWRVCENGSVVGRTVRLPRGRYLIDVDARAEGTENEMMCGVRIGGRTVFRYHAYTRLLCESYRDWVVDLPADAEVECYFDFLSGTGDPTFRVVGAQFCKLHGFEQRAPRLCA